jgi:heme oxygenase
LLTELRRSTQDHHGAIEALLDLGRPWQARRYGDVLRGFNAFLHPFENALNRGLPPHLRPWYATRRRAPLVAEDMAHLGLQVPADLGARAAAVVQTVPTDGVASALGALYVIEGSALGGQVIAPRLAAELGHSPTLGARYFSGFGDRTGALWRDFRDTAAREVGDAPADVRLACRAACLTFDALIAVFAPLLGPAVGDARGAPPALRS